MAPETLNAAASGGAGGGTEGGIYSIPTAVESVYTGAAAYSIPIVVPPGRKGVQPSLALTYNSYASNGWVGVGWDLEIGSIERSTKRGMNYNANDYVSTRDGELVVRSDWGPDYYGAKVEGSFTKYYYNIYTRGWEVRTKDGTIYYYGSTPASRLDYPSGTSKWCLDLVRDTNYNYMTITYTKESGPVYPSQQIYPARIDYTGNNNTNVGTTKSVVFNLYDRSDRIYSYKPKYEQLTTKILRSIQIYADGQLVRSYHLTHSNWSPPTSPSGRNRLTEVLMKDGNGNTIILPTTFAYYNGKGDGNIFGTAQTTALSADIQRGFLFGDINGDGREDFIKLSSTYEYEDYYRYARIFLSNGNGTFTDNGTLSLPRGAVEGKIELGDVDGDGCADIACYPFGNVAVYKSLGTGSFSGMISTGIPYDSYNTNLIHLGDINGDGMMDLIIHKPTSGYVYSHLADGSGTVFNSTGSSTAGFYSGDVKLVDINGDGMADLVREINQSGSGRGITYWISLGNGTFNGFYGVSYTGGVYPFSYNYSDVNGDGLTDLIVKDAIGTVYVHLNYGGSFNNTYYWTNTGFGAGSTIRASDVNGDGMSDIITTNSSGSNFVSYSIGSGYFTPGVAAGGSSVIGDVFTADVNGDGSTDLLKCASNTMYISLAQTDGPADYLKTVTNELGGTSTLTYANSSIYQDNYCPFILHPVSRIVTNDLTVNSTTQYSYQGATYDSESREFWGFEKVKKTNPDGSTVETSYIQTPYLKGRVDLVETRTLGDTLLQRTDLTWDTHPASPTTYGFARLVQQRTEYENNPSLYSQETYAYDNTNGNLLTTVITGTGAETITKTSSYVNKNIWTWRPSQETMSGSVSGLMRQTDYTHSAPAGNLLTTTNYNDSGTSPVVSMTYDAYGNVTTVTDARSKVTTTTYDADYTYPIIITSPSTGGVVHEIEKTWDRRFGTVLTETDQNGFCTNYLYDGFGRLYWIGYPNGGEVRYWYVDSAIPNRYIRKMTSGSVESYTYYNGFGQAIRTQSAGESEKTIITKMLYDAMGRNYRSEGPLFSNDTQYPYTQIMSYDYLSRPLTVRSPDTSGGNADVTYSYSGFSTTVTDPDGKQKTQTTDHLGRIIRVEEQNGGTYTTTYAYNAAGDLIRTTDHSGNITTYTYDTLGRKKTMNDPDMGAWSYTYDGNGNLLTQTDAKSQVITFTYDDLNRVTSKTYSPSNPIVWYFYDSGTNGIGLPYQVANANATTTYNSYDSMGRALSVTKTITGDTARTTQYTYDLMGKILRTTYPDGYYVTNAYIAGTNLLSTVTGSNGTLYATSSNYKPTGKIGTLTHANGTVTTYTYNAYTTRVSDIVTMKGSTTLQNRHYTYFNSGDIDTVTDNLTGVTYDYTYDDLHRLTDETNTGGFGAMHVTYDAIGNITQKSVGPNTFNLFYDASHKHAVDYVRYNSTNYDYTYDANGNMTQGYDFTNPAAIRLRTITYNVDNMPISIVHGSGKTAALLYDGAGARAKKTVTGGTATTTYYIGDHFEVKNGITTKFFFAGNLRVAQMVGSTVSYFHKDHLGSSTVMTNTSGVLVESTNFEPFGGQRAHTGTDTSAYKFTDQEFDAENGLYNYDARMYDPVIGRFISPDNIIPQPFNPQSLNRYSYCYNNPLIYTDPTGHFGWDLYFYNPYLFGLLAGPMLWQAQMNEYMLDEIVVHGNRSDDVADFMRRAGQNSTLNTSPGASGGSSGGGQNGAGICNLLSETADPVLYKWSQNITQKSGIFQVIVHGTKEGDVLDQNNNPLSPTQLKAEMIEGGWTPGTPVKLLSCYSGSVPDDGGRPYGKLLAIELGVYVTAPAGIAALRPDGTLGWYQSLKDNSGVPDYSYPARLFTFSPDPDTYP